MKSNEHLTAPLCDFFVACWGSKIRQENREVWRIEHSRRVGKRRSHWLMETSADAYKATGEARAI